MTDFSIRDEGEDFGTLVAFPGQDDSFEVSGYATRGQVKIALPIYAHEARALIEILEPLAARDKPYPDQFGTDRVNEDGPRNETVEEES